MMLMSLLTSVLTPRPLDRLLGTRELKAGKILCGKTRVTVRVRARGRAGAILVGLPASLAAAGESYDGSLASHVHQ